MRKNRKKVAIVFGGEIGLAAKDIFEAFGFEYMELPKSTENFHKTGDYFPEEWCFDVKLMYADLVEAINRGADAVVCMTSSIISFIGPCRLPYVAEHQFEDKLRKFTKKDFQYLVFKFFPQVAFWSLVGCLRKLGVRFILLPNFFKLLRVLKLVKLKLSLLHKAKNLMRWMRAREIDKGQAWKVYKEFEEEIRAKKTLSQTNQLFNAYEEKINKIAFDENKRVLKIGLVGDFYALFWEFPVFDLENYICQLFDVEILPTYTIYDMYFSKRWYKDKKVNKKLNKYLSYWAGGSDSVTVRTYIEFLDNYGADGIIQMRTFGCIPEEVSSLALQSINRDQENPPAYLILSFDDHSNPEGIKTRVEAFCNTLLRSKKVSGN